MKQRHQVRKELVQAVYTYILRPDALSDLLMTFDDAYGQSCFEGICETRDELDNAIQEFIEDECTGDLYPIDHAVLLVSTYELMHRQDVPYKVIIDQAIRLAKVFSGDHGFKLVNAVVDKLAHKIRPQEVKGRP